MARRNRSMLCSTVVLAALLGAGCAAKVIAPTPAEVAAKQAAAEAEDTAGRLGQELEQSRADLGQSRAESTRLREDLKTARREAATAQEQYEALRREMDRALDEVLASKASLRGVHNRALAISRIAEVRVHMQSASGRDEPEVGERLSRAEALLVRADQVLEEGNYGGASYLADRAGELIGHARAVAEVTAQQNGDNAGFIPIVPPRRVETVVVSNLRHGPDISRRRVGVAAVGTRLLAVGRLSDWLEVETDEGRLVWIHRTLVR